MVEVGQVQEEQGTISYSEVLVFPLHSVSDSTPAFQYSKVDFVDLSADSSLKPSVEQV